jgi:hypothetical protein
VDNSFAGALVSSGARLELVDSLVLDNEPDIQEGGGVGVMATYEPELRPRLDIRGSTIGHHAIAAVWLDGTGSYRLTGNTLSGGPGTTRANAVNEHHVHGDAVFAMDGVDPWDGTWGLLLEGNTLREGVTGLFLHGASATLGHSGNSFATNDSDLWQQGCWERYEPVDGDLAGLATVTCPEYDRAVFDDLDFDLYLQETEASE